MLSRVKQIEKKSLRPVLKLKDCLGVKRVNNYEKNNKFQNFRKVIVFSSIRL